MAVRAGPVAGVQVRWSTPLTGEDYVALEGWSTATPVGCPWHPDGCCGFKRHGTYRRVRPRGCRIARYYCPATGRTVSLLPNCLAARRTGTLERLEAAVLDLERTGSRPRVAERHRPGIELPGALRWVDRARRDVTAGLAAVRVLRPERFEHVPLTIAGFAAALGLEVAAGHGPSAAPGVLAALRAVVPGALGAVPAPLGFDPRRSSARRRSRQRQHRAGADPPER